MTIHSYGEYLDWHPHLHLLMADGLFMRSGLFYVLPQVSLKPLEELFREREDLQRLAQYIMRNPFSLEKMQFNKPDKKEGFRLTADSDVQADGCVIYRSRMNPKIHRNFEIFTPCELPLRFASLLPCGQPVSLRSAHCRHHPAYPGQEFPARQVHRLVLEQDEGAAPET